MTWLQEIDISSHKKIAFVASGGAAKAAFYHIGVAQALKDFGIYVLPKDCVPPGGIGVDVIVGNSAGSIIGALFANGFDPQTVLQVIKKRSLLGTLFRSAIFKSNGTRGISYLDIFRFEIPTLKELTEYTKNILKLPFIKQKYRGSIGIETLLRELFSILALPTTKGIERYLRETLPINDFTELYEKRGIDLFITATEVNNPRKAIMGRVPGGPTKNPKQDYYLSGVSISEAVAASSALPPFYKPYWINGIAYYDGEIKRALSIPVAFDRNADLIIVSHTFEPYIADPSIGSLTNYGMYTIIEQAVYTTLEQKIYSFRHNRVLLQKLYNYLISDEFFMKLTKGKPPGKEFKRRFKENLEEIMELLFDFLPNRRMIFIPSHNDLFFKDHFNIFTHTAFQIVQMGYHRAASILENHYGLERRSCTIGRLFQYERKRKKSEKEELQLL